MLISAKTDKGPVRTNNQDSYSYGFIKDEAIWAVVCDGMGGSAAGNIASQNTVNIISKSLEDNLRPASDIKFAERLIMHSVTSANAAVFEKASADDKLHGMGTTIVSCIIIDGDICVAHVGDSRAYLISDDSIIQMTTDHSVVQSMVESGQLTEDEAKIHPNKNIITRAVGVSKEINADICQMKVKKDNIVLLCTDGLTNSLDDNEILHTVLDVEFNTSAENLVKKAIANGGSDNITAVLIKIQ